MSPYVNILYLFIVSDVLCPEKCVSGGGNGVYTAVHKLDVYYFKCIVSYLVPYRHHLGIFSFYDDYSIQFGTLGIKSMHTLKVLSRT